MEIIKSMDLKVTPRIHALLHYLSVLTKFGLSWNYSSFSFESYFNALKKVARDCNTNPLEALKNYFSDSISLHYFSLSTKVFLKFGIDNEQISFFKKYTSNKQIRKPAFAIFKNLEYEENGGIKQLSFFVLLQD